MEDLLLAGFAIPLTPWSIVNGDVLVPLMDRVREMLPEEIRHSRMIIERRDEILAEAQRKGGQILDDAKNQAEHMLSESELMSAVQGEVNRVRNDMMNELGEHRRRTFEETEQMKALAYEESRAVREGADRYADTLLMSLEKSLGESQLVVHNGQQHLQRSRHEAARTASQVMAASAAANTPAGRRAVTENPAYAAPYASSSSRPIPPSMPPSPSPSMRAPQPSMPPLVSDFPPVTSTQSVPSTQQRMPEMADLAPKSNAAYYSVQPRPPISPLVGPQPEQPPVVAPKYAYAEPKSRPSARSSAPGSARPSRKEAQRSSREYTTYSANQADF